MGHVSNNPQLSTTEKGLKSFKREAREKPPREVGQRVRVRGYKPKESILSSNFVDYINYN
jgi:hypothetical protein